MDVLDQSEVDALLAAVEDGDTGSEDTGPKVEVFTRSGRTALDGDIEVREYDFKRPERVSKDQMLALEQLHESFSRNFGASLSGFLRTIIEIRVANIEQMTFSEFTHSLPNPTCFGLMSCKPLEGSMCLEVSPLIVYAIVDRLLGGSNADLFIPQRPLTAIELSLVDQVNTRALRSLEEVWEQIVKLTFKMEETESNPALVQIVAPNEVVVVVSYELKMGGRAGTMSLCIPYNVIEPVVEKLSNQTWAAYNRNRRDARLRGLVQSRLDTAALRVTATLAHSTISVRELRELEPGDLILTDKNASAPLTLEIGGQRKFIGHLGQFKGNRAFKVARPFQPKDRV